MQHAGFNDARVTQGGADGGVDVISRSAVAQVKFEARQVSRPQLQTFIGATVRHGERARLYFTGTGYSANALDYASAMRIALFTYELDGRVLPVNEAARELVSRPLGTTSWKPRAAEDHPENLALLWLLLALLFTWLFVTGLFNPANHSLEFGIIAVGSILGGLAFLFWWLLIKAVRAAMVSRCGLGRDSGGVR